MSNTFIRFVAGMVIGFYGVALFTDNTHIASIVAVLCGVALDQLVRRSEKL
jgi:hypothetical protein